MSTSTFNATLSADTSLKNFSEQELIQKLSELAQKGDYFSPDFKKYQSELESRKSASTISGTPEKSIDDQILAIINSKKGGALSNKEKADIKKLLQQRLAQNTSTVSTATKTIDDLKHQLSETQETLSTKEQELAKKEEEYDKLIDADEKIITPREYIRRMRLRNIKRKIRTLEQKSPEKALAYFITKTSFIQGGKFIAQFKKLELFVNSLNSFYTLGSGKISQIRDQISQEIKKMEPKENDTIITQHLKKSIIEDVTRIENALFAKISQPIKIEETK